MDSNLIEVLAARFVLITVVPLWVYITQMACIVKEKKGVILTGDLNVAHKEIDIKNPKSNERNAGFTIEERDDFSKLLSYGYIDTFRYLHPEEKDAYTWWSYMFKARERNTGWRIDYFVVSNELIPRVSESTILKDVYGSDHCPIRLEIN